MPGPYFVKNGTGGDDSGSDWANAAESIAGLLTTATVSGGEIIYCHNTHNYVAGAAITWTLPEGTSTGVVQVLSVDGGDATGASLSGTTVGNLYAGATEATNADANFIIYSTTASTISAGIYVYGVTFKQGTGTSGSDLFVSSNTGGELVFDNCTFWINSTNTAAHIEVGSSANVFQTFRNCVFRFGNASQNIRVRSGMLRFVGCSIYASGTTTLFLPSGTSYNGETVCIGCDWSNATNVLNVATNGGGSNIHLQMNNCIIGTPTTGTHAGLGSHIVEMHACGPTTGTLVIDYYYEDASGVVQDSQATAGYYLTSGGAEAKDDDGNTVKYSLAMAPTAIATAMTPLYTPWFYANVASTGDKTIAVKVATATTALKENEVWLEVEYMGEPGLAGTQRVADSPQTVRECDDAVHLITGTLVRDVTVTGDTRTDTTDAWSFNNADWTAAVAHTLSASINIAEIGYIRCRVGLAKDQDTYVDPKITVS